MKSISCTLKNTYIGKFDYDCDVLAAINEFCHNNDINSGWFSIIGAVKTSCLGFYNQEDKKYTVKKFDEPMEIVSCSGNISIKDGKPFAHMHIVLSDESGCAFGGHVMHGTIVFAGEFIIQSYEGEKLVRGLDGQTGLPLWQNL